jgi:uncharacterized protein YbbK (DUF523 family)/uncharacterized protein YbgA (DUF1722 family)
MDVRPRVIISRCINLEAVRYNGGIVRDEFAEKLGYFVEYIPVCPEVEIGLGVPRAPIDLKKDNHGNIRVFRPSTGEDFTDKMLEFSSRFLSSLGEIDGFLLKAKSPSCGVKDTLLYGEDGKKTMGKTSGLFAQKAMEYFPYLPIEDEGRLRDFWIRYYFLTRIFAFADLRENFKRKDKISDLLNFHKRYKYLLMLFGSQGLKTAGQLLASWNSLGIEETKRRYEKIFRESLSRKPKPSSHVNVIQHIVGHFSELLTKSEKLHISALIKKFSQGRSSLYTIIEILRNLSYRFEDEYLIRQAYLRPFPEDLEF